MKISAPTRTQRDEGLLLTLAVLFVGTGFVTLTLQHALPTTGFLAAGAWALGLLGAHLALNRAVPRRDPLLLPCAALLTGWGLLLVTRLAPDLLWPHTLRLLAGLGAVALLSQLTHHSDPSGLHWLKRYRYTWLTIALALLIATFLLGVNPLGRGLRLWLQVGDIYLQPSELLKVPLLVYLAGYLSEHHPLLANRRIPLFDRARLPYLIPLMLTWALSLVLLVLQRDLGTASIFLLVFLAMLYIATEDLTYLVGGALLLGVSGLIAMQVYNVVAQRVAIWLDPFANAQGAGFQIVQSLYAIASGGVFGQGLGQGSPGYIPAVHTDFPFAAITEEFGLLGALAVLACYAVLVVRAARAATLSADPFHLFLAAGIGLLFGLQSAVIVGGNIKLIPLTGVTLPFVSYGGSSLLASFIMLWILLRISQETADP